MSLESRIVDLAVAIGADIKALSIAGGGPTFTGLKTANYTAVAGEVIRTNSGASGPFTVTLPAAPVDGDTVSVFDVTNSCYGDPVLLLPVSCTVEGDSTGLSINMNGAYLTVVYNAVLADWKVADTYAGAFTTQAEPLSPFLLMGA